MNVDFRTIAVGDDDLQIIESLRNLLESSGYSAETLTSAEHFLSSPKTRR
jgi:FixJ family two-component response regulator